MKKKKTISKKATRQQQWDAHKQCLADKVEDTLVKSGITIPLIQRSAMRDAVQLALEEARNWKPEK